MSLVHIAEVSLMWSVINQDTYRCCVTKMQRFIVTKQTRTLTYPNNVHDDIDVFPQVTAPQVLIKNVALMKRLRDRMLSILSPSLGELVFILLRLTTNSVQ